MKKWMMFIIMSALLLLFGACNDTEVYPTGSVIQQPKPQLSDTCDYILCQGTDTDGNIYQLVADQEETALSYTVTVGIIKNNVWFVPMSSNSPFLTNSGLFPMEGGLDLGTIARVKLVASCFYFIDSGAFLMHYVNLNRGDIRVIYNCNTKQTYQYVEHDDGYEWVYSYYKLKTRKNYEQYDVIFYGEILTDNQFIILFRDVSDAYAWDKPKTYDWYIMDTKTMNTRKIASNVIRNYPKSCLSEGLFFAADDCFYNIDGKKVIDLSRYNIDIWENGAPYFKNGECTFITENDRGTEFEVTIDISGKVLSEKKR